MKAETTFSGKISRTRLGFLDGPKTSQFIHIEVFLEEYRAQTRAVLKESLNLSPILISYIMRACQRLYRFQDLDPKDRLIGMLRVRDHSLPLAIYQQVRLFQHQNAE